MECITGLNCRRTKKMKEKVNVVSDGLTVLKQILLLSTIGSFLFCCKQKNPDFVTSPAIDLSPSEIMKLLDLAENHGDGTAAFR